MALLPAFRENRDMRALCNAADWAEHWLSSAALPVWWQLGADRTHGGFYEKLSLTGEPAHEPRRFRVQVRQLYVYAEAQLYKLYDQAPQAMDHALATVLPAYVPGQGFPKLLSPENKIVDASFDPYDNAFGLYGLAAAYRVSGDKKLAEMARDLTGIFDTQHKHPIAGYIEPLPLRANPHMHLLEAFMLWAEATEDQFWYDHARAMTKLCTERFFDRQTNTLREFFDLSWQVFPGPQGQQVEPGHHYEWAWLLDRWKILSGEDHTDIADALYLWAEAHGVDPARGVAVDEMTADGQIVKPTARQWPQTERLKAALSRWQRTQDSAAVEVALSSMQALQVYLSAPTEGLWHDTMQPDGSFKKGPAWASSFYHYMCAFVELRNAAATVQNNQ